MTQDADRIKIICKIQEDGAFQEQLLLNESDTADEAARQASRLLRLFSPEQLTRQLSAQYGAGSVLVFRTDTRQMQEFSDLLTAHGGQVMA